MDLEELIHYLFYDGAMADIVINYTMLLVSTTVSWSPEPTGYVHSVVQNKSKWRIFETPSHCNFLLSSGSNLVGR